ncbi:MAG: MEDS domain-containing protein [Gemmatimonadaceae bacterium]|nr:MEDS domain-containing protein [Gemmatimonadaceae bacterium]
MAVKQRVELGILDETVRVGEHIAYFWEDEKEFVRGVNFLAVGLRGNDHGVIFGHEDANEKVLETLRGQGIAVDDLLASGRLTVLGGASAGDKMLATIGACFQKAVDGGCDLIRLLGNIGWGHPDWPGQEDILAFEAKVTGAAKAFPCVVLCMYDVDSLPGRVMVHGAFETHPLTFCRNVLRENPYFVDVDEFKKGMPAATL